MRLHLFVQHLAQLHWYDTPFSIAQHQSATSFVGQSDKRKFSFFSQTTQRQHPKNFIALEFYFQAILLQSKSWGGIRDSNSCFGFHRPAPQPLGQSRHQTGASDLIRTGISGSQNHCPTVERRRLILFVDPQKVEWRVNRFHKYLYLFDRHLRFAQPRNFDDAFVVWIVFRIEGADHLHKLLRQFIGKLDHKRDFHVRNFSTCRAGNRAYGVKIWSWDGDLNSGPRPYQGRALTT